MCVFFPNLTRREIGKIRCRIEKEVKKETHIHTREERRWKREGSKVTRKEGRRDTHTYVISFREREKDSCRKRDRKR